MEENEGKLASALEDLRVRCIETADQVFSSGANRDPAETPQLDLERLAGNIGKILEAYRAVVRASGRTSMRADVAALAFDLRTGRSPLQSFLAAVQKPAP